MDKSQLPQPSQFTKAITDMQAKRRAVFKASETEITARSELARVRAWHVRQGLEGKNQAEREANLEQVVLGEQLALEAAEATVRKARYEHEIATLELERLRYWLRVAEALVRLEGGEQ